VTITLLIINFSEDTMKNISLGGWMLCLCLSMIVGTSLEAQGKLLSAYISDSPSSSVPAWIAKETGLLKKYGLDIDLVFIDGSTRGIQSLLAGDLSFTEAVGTSAINGRIAGGDIAIVKRRSQHIALLHRRQSQHQIA
jgi:ABC-type nitrate/sulfonate/bicarbonate transport system substrate-binding protein